MKLYTVNYKGSITNYEWSIVTIHKTLQSAEKAVKMYNLNWSEHDLDKPKYVIYVIDTDVDKDIIYDYDDVDNVIKDDEFYNP